MIRIGSDADFTRVREFLAEHYVNERLEAVTRDWETYFGLPAGLPGTDDPLLRLLFLACEVPAGIIERVVPEPVRDAMHGLGLLDRNGDRYRASAMLYNVGPVLIASDPLPFQDTRPDPASLDPEFVYLALTDRTRSFIAMLPDEPCDAFLDLGAGSGAAALLAARHARVAWAADISERSTLYAEFNARLNGAANVHSVRGSLYEPVAGLTFDVIACHPPYDIASHLTFADGGPDGEFVLRGAVKGLPDFLRPSGQFFAQARAADHAGKPLEFRLREWLGDRHHQFDIAIVVRETLLPQGYAAWAAVSEPDAARSYWQYLDRFSELHVEQLTYCNILIWRKAEASQPLTLRRKLGTRCTASELRWLVESQRNLPELDISAAYPATSPAAELHVRHGMNEGRLEPRGYSIHTSAPFADQVTCPEWVARLLAACDGRHTTAEIYEHIRKQRPVPREEFDLAVRRLFAIGAVTLPQFTAAQ